MEKEITIKIALANYFKAAEKFNELISKKEAISDQIIKECAYWAMMVLYCYGSHDNWTPEMMPRVPIPIQLTRDIANNLQKLLSGHIPQWMLHLQKTGAPQANPRMAEAIGLAVAYKKLADTGLIKDRRSTKTISEAFGVSKRCVQGWINTYSYSEPADFFPQAADESARSSLVAAALPKVGEQYREWGRAPSNSRPFGKAKRRPSAKL